MNYSQHLQQLAERLEEEFQQEAHYSSDDLAAMARDGVKWSQYKTCKYHLLACAGCRAEYAHQLYLRQTQPAPVIQPEGLAEWLRQLLQALPQPLRIPAPGFSTEDPLEASDLTGEQNNFSYMLTPYGDKWRLRIAHEEQALALVSISSEGSAPVKAVIRLEKKFGELFGDAWFSGLQISSEMKIKIKELPSSLGLEWEQATEETRKQMQTLFSEVEQYPDDFADIIRRIKANEQG